MSDFNEQGAFTGSSIDLDAVSGGGQFIPPGRYTVSLSAVTGKPSKAGKPMVHAQYEILDGEYESLEFNIYYTMGLWAPKKPGGKTFAPGIAEIKATCANVGDPLPTGYQFPIKDGAGDADKAAKILGQKLRGKKLTLINVEEVVKNKETKQPELNDDGTQKKTTRAKILGLANKAAATDSEDLGL